VLVLLAWLDGEGIHWRGDTLAFAFLRVHHVRDILAINLLMEELFDQKIVLGYTPGYTSMLWKK
jgi:hypothetical protein